MIESLGRQEVQRQGLWWELVKGEVEFVRDLRVVTQVSPTVLVPIAKFTRMYRASSLLFNHTIRRS
jgi:hypothetical protein